jgi:hypothetical protein
MCFKHVNLQRSKSAFNRTNFVMWTLIVDKTNALSILNGKNINFVNMMGSFRYFLFLCLISMSYEYLKYYKNHLTNGWKIK